MSSWKNAHKSYQKPHRERHQPEARKHLGILEKKKDYKLRADDFNAKKAELKFLEKKALDRNPDEFYYHMINSKVDDGIHKDKEKELSLTPEELALMQSQDLKYISNKRVIEAKKVEKLKATLNSLDVSQAPKNRHTFFVEDEKEVAKFHPAKQFGTDPCFLKRRFNRIRNADLQKKEFTSLVKMDPEVVKNLVNENQKSYSLLEQRAKRAEKLLTLQRKMELKRALQDKTRTIKQRIKPETANGVPVYIWKQERKR